MFHTIEDPDSAVDGLNRLLDIMDGDVAILAHQDMYFPRNFVFQVKQQLKKLPEDWAVAGIIGKDKNGKFCGHLHDTRLPFKYHTIDIHEFPERAACFDECCLIINLNSGFRFEPVIDGFDLYGTLCVLQAEEMNKSAWIIDAFASHHCMRPFTWVPDEDFRDNFKRIYDRFPGAERIDSTVLGAEKEDNKAA